MAAAPALTVATIAPGVSQGIERTILLEIVGMNFLALRILVEPGYDVAQPLDAMHRFAGA